ncbi:glycoside hydrolase [Lophium mytilinum]|uniref:glucan endo-1,6-beta-glucosidase n=1 Tax=Lophium mytilinum TaxID=390894 RepID=A0A6A6QTE8_9PEZI|nr:glycoside hydrolase [Lophium mytilinum]
MHIGLISILSLVAVVSAWLPSDTDLFGPEPQTNATFSNLSAGKGRVVKKWLPSSGKIRGVNLGSLFVVEPWMASTEWATMGCGSSKSEFDCVMKLGQDAANAAFKAHWARWITETDFDDMASYGLNTVRIPLGYWIDESLVYDSEHFPQGGLAYLDKVVGWAAARNIYVILDLHAAPGAQVAQQPFTGQYAPTTGFYQDYQYDRAYKFLQFITNRIHSNTAYRTVGMLEVLNEPVNGQSSLVNTYYPTAFSKIRETESGLGITDNAKKLHVQFMNKLWGSGDPKSGLKDLSNTAFDNHRYLKWDTSVKVSQAGYIAASCADQVASDGDKPLIVGEWSISPADAVEQSSAFEVKSGSNSGFYTKWWAAQVIAYEKQQGWVFWSWKAQLNGDYRWSYKDAVEKGIIPKDPGQAYNQGVC